MNELLEIINKISDLSKRNHYYCEDSWYSCPKAPDGSADESKGDECDCGAEEHNREVEIVLQRLLEELIKRGGE